MTEQQMEPVTPPPGRLPVEELERLSAMVATVPFVRKVLDAMPELVAVLTPTRQIVAANQAMMIFLELDPGDFQPGARPGELLGCVHSHVDAQGCGHSKYCSQCGAFHTIVASITNHQKATGECRLTFQRQGQKQSLDLYLWCAPFEVDGYPFSILAGVDISDQKRREALERIFFHDLLNTFQILGSQIDLLHFTQPDMDPGRIERLRGVANSLSDEVLAQRDLLRAEKGGLEVRVQPLQSGRIVMELAAAFVGWRGMDRNLRVDAHMADLEFHSDQVLVKRILGNMVKNALEASDDHQEVLLGCSEGEGGGPLFWVRNQQVMPPEVQDQVFQRSFSTKGEGRGLGTYGMRLLAERYLKGEVWFQSQEGRGTIFYLALPAELSQ